MKNHIFKKKNTKSNEHKNIKKIQVIEKIINKSFNEHGDCFHERNKLSATTQSSIDSSFSSNSNKFFSSPLSNTDSFCDMGGLCSKPFIKLIYFVDSFNQVVSITWPPTKVNNGLEDNTDKEAVLKNDLLNFLCEIGLISKKKLDYIQNNTVENKFSIRNFLNDADTTHDITSKIGDNSSLNEDPNVSCFHNMNHRPNSYSQKKNYFCNMNFKIESNNSEFDVDLKLTYKLKNEFINKAPSSLYISNEELSTYLKYLLILRNCNIEKKIKNFMYVESKVKSLLKLTSFLCFLNKKKTINQFFY